MFRAIRRIKQKLSEDESINLLKELPRGFLAISGENGYPFNIPINYAYYDNNIIIHTPKSGLLYESIQKYEKVCFTVLDDGKQVENEWYKLFKSVIVYGKIKTVTDDDEKNKFFRILGDKYYPDMEYTENIIKKSGANAYIHIIEIDHISGKYVLEK